MPDELAPLQRSPSWTREEIVLATDLYLESGRRIPGPNEAAVIELSAILQKLPFHDPVLRPDQFRNPAGVSMKIRNIRSVDPTWKGAPSNVSKLDSLFWDEFGGDADHLHAAAAAIRANITNPAASVPTPEEYDGIEEAPEGRLLMRVHVARERNRQIVATKKARALNQTGALACEICGFDFQAVYGDLGEGFIECHHIVPLHHLEGQGITKLEDLILVCANCHRMLHRGGTHDPATIRDRLQTPTRRS